MFSVQIQAKVHLGKRSLAQGEFLREEEIRLRKYNNMDERRFLEGLKDKHGERQ